MSEPQQPSAQPYGAPTPPPYTPGSPYGQNPASGQPGQASSDQPAAGYGQPYGQAPAYAPQSAEPAAAPGAYGAPSPAYGAPSSGNPLGRTAFIVAAASAALGLLFAMITPILYTSGNYDIADSLGTVLGILVLIGGIAAGVLSILALRRPAPHLLAAIALGIAGSVVIGRALSWMASFLYYLF